MQGGLSRIVGMVVASYLGLSVLRGFWAPLPILVTVLAVVYAATLWILEYERALAARLYREHGFLQPVLDKICAWTHQQSPVAEATGGPDSPGESAESAERVEEGALRLLLQSEDDFRSAAEDLKYAFRGSDSVIDGMLAQLRHSTAVRARSNPSSSQPPLGIFLFMGASGLGKRYLAEQFSWHLYKDGAATSLDLADGEGHLDELLQAVKRRPYQTIVLENVERASSQFLERLQAVARGSALRGQDGATVSFRHCVFFLVCHRDGAALGQLKDRGVTMAASLVGQITGLPAALVNYIHGYYAFSLPAKLDQAEVVGLLMELECQRFNLTLGRVDPEVLMREVNAIDTAGTLEIAPGRIAKRLRDSIQAALDSNATTVDVSAQ